MKNDSKRYIRQMTLPEIGEEGQRKLAQARVLVVGAGGLGSPVLLYLAGAGVGTIGIVDNDKIELINLHRQVMHNAKNRGKPKSKSAKKVISELNPDINVKTYDERLTSSNVSEIFDGYNLVVDCVDNFETRYIANAECVKRRVPYIHGAILRYKGEVAIFDSKTGPCFSCIFPEPPPESIAPKGSEAGILGTMAGVVGVIQAHEAIKYIAGFKKTLTGKLLIFDGLECTMRTLELRKDPNCEVCS